MLTLVSSVIIFGLVIFFHELGHFLIAKWVGISVMEFAIGFGPRLLSRQAGETTYSLRAFPFGGFVRLTGEDPDEAEEEGSFQNQPVWRRIAVIAAGPLMNFMLAVILFSTIYFAFIGIPIPQTTTIGELVSGEQAENVGLRPGDRLLRVDGEEVNNWNDLVAQINANPERPISIEFEREGRVRSVEVTPRRDEQTGVGIIGIWPKTRLYAFSQSIQRGFTHTLWLARFILVSIVQMVTGSVPAEVTGPVGIIQAIGEVAQTGMVNLLSLAAVISASIGLFNLLPIPALDGSRLMFLGFEALRGRPVDPNKEAFVHFVGFTVLIFLMILITYRDLTRLNIFS